MTTGGYLVGRTLSSSLRDLSLDWYGESTNFDRLQKGTLDLIWIGGGTGTGGGACRYGVRGSVSEEGVRGPRNVSETGVVPSGKVVHVSLEEALKILRNIYSRGVPTGDCKRRKERRIVLNVNKVNRQMND